MSRSIESETDLQNRLIAILKGISQNLNDSEIASKLGVNRWLIQREVRSMRFNGDPRLKQAESSREAIRLEKIMRLIEARTHTKQNEKFLHMTGITLEEKNFRNMIDFHKSKLMKIMKADDQSAAIRGLPGRERMTMLHNGILNGRRGSPATWRVTARAKEYLAVEGEH